MDASSCTCYGAQSIISKGSSSRAGQVSRFTRRKNGIAYCGFPQNPDEDPDYPGFATQGWLFKRGPNPGPDTLMKCFFRHESFAPLARIYGLCLVASACRFGGPELRTDSEAISAPSPSDKGVIEGGISDSANAPTTLQGFSISGVWAEKWVNASIDKVPILGQVAATTTTYLRLQVYETSGNVTAQAETCALDIDGGTDVVKSIAPDALIRSLGISTRKATLTEENGTLVYRQSECVELRGVRLTTPSTEALPTSPDDPRVYDQDGDGKPGITVRVTGLIDGEVYLCQRDLHFRDGRVVGKDTIRGLTAWTRHQSYLGSDNQVLNDNPVESSTNPDPSLSYFVMHRIDSRLDCQGIAVNAEEIFGP